MKSLHDWLGENYNYDRERDEAQRADEFCGHPETCTCRSCALDKADEPRRVA